MDIEFFEPSRMPVSPEETRIESIRAEAYPDGRRIKVYLEVTPSQGRPNLEIRMLDPQGREVASANIIEAMDTTMMITMHLRGQLENGLYTVGAKLSFDDPVQVSHESQIELELNFPEETVGGE